jgi:hypothetical protein
LATPPTFKTHLNPTSATMKPEYTNHITTINHPSFGTLRLIHIDGEPWLCVTDINRILTSTKISWGEAMLSDRQVRHASGLKFVNIPLTVACLAAPRDTFIEWMLPIVLTGGKTGPTPFREHPGPNLAVAPSPASTHPGFMPLPIPPRLTLTGFRTRMRSSLRSTPTRQPEHFLSRTIPSPWALAQKNSSGPATSK